MYLLTTELSHTKRMMTMATKQIDGLFLVWRCVLAKKLADVT